MPNPPHGRSCRRARGPAARQRRRRLARRRSRCGPGCCGRPRSSRPAATTQARDRRRSCRPVAGGRCASAGGDDEDVRVRAVELVPRVKRDAGSVRRPVRVIRGKARPAGQAPAVGAVGLHRHDRVAVGTVGDPRPVRDQLGSKLYAAGVLVRFVGSLPSSRTVQTSKPLPLMRANAILLPSGAHGGVMSDAEPGGWVTWCAVVPL